MLILWRERAEEDLGEIFDYLLERNPAAARGVRGAIMGSVAVLGDHPGLGRPGRVTETRELVITGTPYLVAYAVDPRIGAVIILRVLHGARLWPEAL